MEGLPHSQQTTAGGAAQVPGLSSPTLLLEGNLLAHCPWPTDVGQTMHMCRYVFTFSSFK